VVLSVCSKKHSGAGLDEKGLRYLDSIANSARHMGKLVDDLSNFSRMARQELRHVRVDLGPLVEAVRDLFNFFERSARLVTH